MKKASNEDYLTCSYINGKGVLISRLNNQGYRKWSKLYSNINFGRWQWIQVAPTKNNGFLFVSDYTAVNNIETYSLTKCDSNGVIIWAKTINSGDEFENNTFGHLQLCESPLGNIYFLTNNGHKFFQIMKLDKSGNALWCRRYQDPTYLYSVCVEISSGEDDGLAVLRSTSSCEGYCGFSSVHKYDKNGKQELSQDLNLYDSFSSLPIAVTYNKTSIIAVVQTDLVYVPAPDEKKYSYWTIDRTTKKINALSMDRSLFTLKDFFERNKIELAKEMTFNNDHDLWAIINKDWSLTRVEDLFYHKHYKISKYDRFNRICPSYIPVKFGTKTTVEKNITIGGTEYEDQSYQFTIDNFKITISDYALPFRTSCSGSGPFNATIEQNNLATQGSLKINFYPNPVITTITLSGLSNKSNTILQVLNTNGSVLKEITTSSSIFNLDVHALIPGAYLLRINNGKEVITRTLIKQ